MESFVTLYFINHGTYYNYEIGLCSEKLVLSRIKLYLTFIFNFFKTRLINQKFHNYKI